MNMFAVKEVVAFAKALNTCAALVHTSTAYTHTYRADTPEEVLTPMHDPEDVLNLLDTLDEDAASALCPELTKQHPNTSVPPLLPQNMPSPALTSARSVPATPSPWPSLSGQQSSKLDSTCRKLGSPPFPLHSIFLSSYPPFCPFPRSNCIHRRYTFTKCLAEAILQSSVDDVPTCVVRPSIVVPAWHEPYPGWTDTYNGPTGLMTAAGTGLLRVIRGSPLKKCDIVPVDIVVNMLIVAAWQTHRKSLSTTKSEDNRVIVYNCVSGQAAPLTWGSSSDMFTKAWRK